MRACHRTATDRSTAHNRPGGCSLCQSDTDTGSSHDHHRNHDRHTSPNRHGDRHDHETQPRQPARLVATDRTSGGAGPRSTWGLVAGASIAAVVLAVSVLDNDGGQSDRTLNLHAGPVGDAKDHENFGPVVATQATVSGLGDAKDHENFGPVVVTQATASGLGDAKDHENFGPVVATQATASGLGDAKDHENFGPVTASETVVWSGDAKDHSNFGSATVSETPSSGPETPRITPATAVHQRDRDRPIGRGTYSSGDEQ